VVEISIDKRGDGSSYNGSGVPAGTSVWFGDDTVSDDDDYT
jgi:hypothetical protein